MRCTKRFICQILATSVNGLLTRRSSPMVLVARRNNRDFHWNEESRSIRHRTKSQVHDDSNQPLSFEVLTSFHHLQTDILLRRELNKSQHNETELKIIYLLLQSLKGRPLTRDEFYSFLTKSFRTTSSEDSCHDVKSIDFDPEAALSSSEPLRLPALARPWGKLHGFINAISLLKKINDWWDGVWIGATAMPLQHPSLHHNHHLILAVSRPFHLRLKSQQKLRESGTLWMSAVNSLKCVRSWSTWAIWVVDAIQTVKSEWPTAYLLLRDEVIESRLNIFSQMNTMFVNRLLTPAAIGQWKNMLEELIMKTRMTLAWDWRGNKSVGEKRVRMRRCCWASPTHPCTILQTAQPNSITSWHIFDTIHA